jgi:hypothetical protein
MSDLTKPVNQYQASGMSSARATLGADLKKASLESSPGTTGTLLDPQAIKEQLRTGLT